MERMKGLHGVQLFESNYQEEKMDKVSKCPDCKQDIKKDEGVTFKKYNGNFFDEITFCSKACARKYYLHKLREAGM